MTLTANGGRYTHAARRVLPLADMLADRAHAIEYEPWGPVQGQPESHAKPGRAEVRVRLSTCQRLPREGEALGFLKTVATIDVPPRAVTLLPPAEAKAAPLAFRIVPNRMGSSRLPALGPVKPYLEDLAANGPLAGRRRGEEFQWFPVRGEVGDRSVTAKHEGREYILLCGRPPYVMAMGGEEAWTVSRTEATKDERTGHWSVACTLDAQGARLFHALTAANTHNALAILVDGEVVAAPVIRSALRGSVVITGAFTEDAARKLADALRADARAGAAKPRPDPVAKELRRIVALREQQVERVQRLSEAGAASGAEVAQARVALAEARVRLLEREEARKGRAAAPGRDAAKDPIARELRRIVALGQEQVALTCKLVETGRALEADVTKAELALAEARLRLAQRLEALRADAPAPREYDD
ncbi:MAG: SecDF P1 head subdomain-containing protein [bacterium]